VFKVIFCPLSPVRCVTICLFETVGRKRLTIQYIYLVIEQRDCKKTQSSQKLIKLGKQLKMNAEEVKKIKLLPHF